MAEIRPLDTLVRTLYDLRLALVALATVVEVAAAGSALAIVALLVALPVSFVPLRRWATTGRRLATNRSWLFLDAIGAATLTVLVTDPQVMLLYSVVTVMVAGLAAGRIGAFLTAAVLASFLVLALVVGLLARAATSSDVATSLVFVAIYVLCAVGSVRLARFLRDYDRAVEAARAASRRAAQAEERGRLAREMHDSLSKTIQGTHLMAIAVSKRLAAHGAEPRLVGEADQLVMACDIASRDARRLLDGLRDEGGTCALTSVSRKVGEVVLDWQTRTAVPVAMDSGVHPGEDDLPAELVYEVCCVVGEALDNAHRHGAARRVEVSLAARDGWLEVTVADDGAGFAVPDDLAALHRSGHYGVIGMSERAQRVGGRLVVTSTPGGGTTVGLSVPAPELSQRDAVAGAAGS